VAIDSGRLRGRSSGVLVVPVWAAEVRTAGQGDGDRRMVVDTSVDDGKGVLWVR
jgi:hypothetical protein